MAELVYAQDLKSCDFGHVGSTPTTRTNFDRWGYKMEVIEYIFQIIILAISFWIAYESTIMIDEKRSRRSEGLTDYYDNPVE